MNTFLFFRYRNRMLIFILFSKRVQILKTEYKYGQQCTPLTQSDCRSHFFVLAIMQNMQFYEIYLYFKSVSLFGKKIIKKKSYLETIDNTMCSKKIAHNIQIHVTCTWLSLIQGMAMQMQLHHIVLHFHQNEELFFYYQVHCINLSGILRSHIFPTCSQLDPRLNQPETDSDT